MIYYVVQGHFQATASWGVPGAPKVRPQQLIKQVSENRILNIAQNPLPGCPKSVRNGP